MAEEFKVDMSGRQVMGVARVISTPSTSREGTYHFTFVFNKYPHIFCTCEGWKYHEHCRHVDELTRDDLEWCKERRMVQREKHSIGVSRERKRHFVAWNRLDHCYVYMCKTTVSPALVEPFGHEVDDEDVDCQVCRMMERRGRLHSGTGSV